MIYSRRKQGLTFCKFSIWTWKSTKIFATLPPKIKSPFKSNAKQEYFTRDKRYWICELVKSRIPSRVKIGNGNKKCL